MNILIFCLWYATGFFGFIYWRKDEIIMPLILGFLGPVAWIIGLIVHSDQTK
jgi:cyanate permease